MVCLLPPAAGVTNWGGGVMCSLLRGAVPPSHLADACSEYGSACWVRVGQAGVNMSDASGQPPSAWEEGPKRPRCQDPGDFAEKQAAWQGLGRQARPLEFSGLICPSETRTWRAGDSWNDMPKVTAQILGTGRVSPGTPPGSLLRGPGGQQRSVREGGPCGAAWGTS